MPELKTIEYQDGKLVIIDTTKLPSELVYLELKTLEECFDAIKQLKVRGAPAIGVAAAYSLTIISNHITTKNYDEYYNQMKQAADYLKTSRPTAVNLFWAIERMMKTIEKNHNCDMEQLKKHVEQEEMCIRDSIYKEQSPPDY